MELDDPLRRKRRYILLAVAAGLLLAAGLVVRPAYRGFKHWRALQMAEASAQALAGRDLKTAAEKADAAWRLWPWDAKVTRQEAKVLTLENPASALPVWIQTWSLSHDLSDLRQVVETALASGNNPIAITQFDLLQKADPQNPATWLLEAKIRFNQQQWPEALNETKRVLDSGNAPPEAHLLYAAAAMNSGDPVLARDGLQHLSTLMERTDELGLQALRLLGNYPMLTAAEAATVAQKLENHPLATRGDKLLALRLDSLQPGASQEDLVKAARDLFPPNDPDVMNVVALWLMRQGKYAAVLQLIDSQTALSRKDLFLLRSDAMAAMGQWQAIEKSLESTDPRPPLPEAERLMYQARALTELGQSAQAQIAWERAMNSVGNEPGKLLDMAEYAVKLKLDNVARPAFQQLLKEPDQRRAAYEQLAQLEHRARDTKALHQLLLDMAKAYPDDLAVRSDVLYTGFLLGEAGPEQVAAARKLVADSKAPYLAFRVTLALGLLESDQPAEALKVFDDVTDSTWPAANAGWNAVYVGVLRANGQRSKADRLEQSINANALLMEEKKLLLIPIPAGS